MRKGLRGKSCNCTWDLVWFFGASGNCQTPRGALHSHNQVRLLLLWKPSRITMLFTFYILYYIFFCVSIPRIIIFFKRYIDIFEEEFLPIFDFDLNLFIMFLVGKSRATVPSHSRNTGPVWIIRTWRSCVTAASSSRASTAASSISWAGRDLILETCLRWGRTARLISGVLFLPVVGHARASDCLCLVVSLGLRLEQENHVLLLSFLCFFLFIQ